MMYFLWGNVPELQSNVEYIFMQTSVLNREPDGHSRLEEHMQNQSSCHQQLQLGPLVKCRQVLFSRDIYNLSSLSYLSYC